MYNRHPILPIDLKYDLDSELSNPNIPFDIEGFQAILSSILDLWQEHHDQAGENIAKAQKKQQRDYNLRHSQPVSYTHLRAHETRGNLVCRLLLEKKINFSF